MIILGVLIFSSLKKGGDYEFNSTECTTKDTGEYTYLITCQREEFDTDVLGDDPNAPY
mgnify:CR=1 FL=1